MNLKDITKPIIAEQATGIKEKGSLNFWSEGLRITEKQARKYIKEEKEIAVPGAGAGSYLKIFKMLGFDEVEDVETGSSAGDWTFAVKDKSGWGLAFQTNRYPYYGFNYSISKELQGFTTFEDLIKETEIK